MENYLKETLIFNNLLGCDTSFDFITGRDFFQQNIISNNITSNNLQNDENKISKSTSINKNSDNNTKETYDKNNNEDESGNIKQDEKIGENSAIKCNVELTNVKTFEDIVEKIKSFNGCDLKRHATNDVIFDGNKNAKIMLIGEAPGQTEDQEGKPFCGQSGQLLRKALKCINLTTDNLFITNTVYWRPPDNRKPYPEEIEICRPFLNKMIEIINPSIIILCGATAIETILKTKKTMTQMTGKIQEAKIVVDDAKTLNIKTFPIYHPSYLLRVPTMKKTFWQHLLILQQEINKL